MSSLENLTTSEMARLMGISARHVGRLAREGVITKAGRGKYPPEAVAQYCEFLRRDAHAGPADWQTERARLARIRADLAELELGARRREVLDRGEVDQAVISEFARVRAHLLAVPTTFAPRLAKGMAPAVAEGILRDAIHGVLRQLSEPDFAEEEKNYEHRT